MSPKIALRTRRGRWAAFWAAVFLVVLGAPSGARAIVGGSPADGVLAHSSVMVLNSRGGVCSAVVVAVDAVLTAAHCVARATEVRVHFRDPSGEPVLIVPLSVASHPGFAADAVAARRRSIDLALVRLPAPLPARFRPASLSTSTISRGDLVEIGGFGVSAEADGRSSGVFRAATAAAVEPYGPSTILLWAAGVGAGACEGDSGGPMANGSGDVVAVTSWAAGSGRQRCGKMSQGVLVAPQRSWIDTTLSSWGRTATWQ